MVWGVFDWSDPKQAKSEDGSEADYPECDYDTNLTPLYEAIEERAWIAVNQFLHSGYWPESLFADAMSPEEQARTWVTRYETRPDGSKKVRWSQLPIHAAVIFGAPSVVIQQLVEAFPQSVRCTDDHRMLPLHLAFRHGSDDSVLALFLEEFPEAVNVRGYKGRLPVECALKGPNPERGAIIQTILHKNQSVWERKKSAVQLKELYCIKEALKIKSQKVSHLETAIREIKSREHKTRKELATTMTELKAAKIKTKVEDQALNSSDTSAERRAVKQLVEKLAALEMATKDLVDKEKATKKELKKTIAELEATKNMKPTDDQRQQFAQLYKVASVEEINQLDRVAEGAQLALNRLGSKVSFDDEAKKEASKVMEAPLIILKNAEVMEATPHKSTKTGVKEEKPTNTSGNNTQEPMSITTETPVGASTTPEIPSTREAEKRKPSDVGETNESLVKKIAKLEAAMEDYKEQTSKAQEDLEAISVPDQNNDFTEHQTEQMAAIQAELKLLKASSEKTKVDLENTLQKLNELRITQDDRVSAAFVEKTRMHKESNKINKNLEQKVALLEIALRQFEQKSSLAKTEMNNIKETMQHDSDVKLTSSQQRYLARLEESMKKLEKNARQTKKELEIALVELDTMKVKDMESAQLLATMENEKFKSVEETNKALEEKIALLESTMKCFEEKAAKTREEMVKAMQDLKKSDESTVASGESMKLTKKQKKQIKALESIMKKLEDRAISTKAQLDQALEELTDLKKAEEVAYVKNESLSKRESKAMKDLAKKVQALQTAMVGFEVKETRTMQELEKAMAELEDVSNKRFEVLSKVAEKSEEFATDSSLTKEVAKLDKRATKEEKRIAELEEAVQDIITKSGNTKEELERTKQLLEEIMSKNEAREPAQTKEEKDEVKQDKKLIKELTKKVTTLQSAVIGFEVKETRTMKELEHTMKQLEELTSKRFEVLEKAATIKEKDTERLVAAGALAEEKVAALHTAMRELEQNSTKTHEELEKTKLELETMKAANLNGDGINKKIIASQENQIKELHEKILVLQQAVMGFEVKETKTMQELEQTMKQLEELTAKRFEVLQKVAGREIEAAKSAEANKYSQKAAQGEKKVAALEFAMRELESKAYKTKLELERTMKGLEQLEEKQEVSQQEVAGVTKEEKRVICELVNKVADIQEAVMAYDEKEHKTAQELEKTKQELEATKQEVEMLRLKQGVVTEETQIIATNGGESKVEAVEVNDNEDSAKRKKASENAKRVTEETLSSLETAIHRLVERLGTEDEQEGVSSVAEKIVATFSKDERFSITNDVNPSTSEEQTDKESTVQKEDKLVPLIHSNGEKPAFASSISRDEAEKLASADEAIIASAGAQLLSTIPAEANSKPQKRRSFFGRLSSSSKLKRSRKLGKKRPMGLRIFGGSKKSSAKSAALIQNNNTSSPVVTPEQRKAVEVIHGAEICALLTDEQVQGLLSAMKDTPSTAIRQQSSIEIVSSALSTEKYSTSKSVGGQSTASQSAAEQSRAESSVSLGIKEEDPHMMIVSLPSQRGIPASSSMKSVKSQKSEKTVPTSPRSNKVGSISPGPLSPAIKSIPDKPKDVLVAAGTYDDGFEINF